MTKRELIEALEVSETEDKAVILFRTSTGELHEVEIFGVDTEGDIVLAEEFGK